MSRNKGIGIFDSGVGGLTVASQVAKKLPRESIIYFGDTAHLPYGDKSEEEITIYVESIIEFLKSEGIKALIMACNTSSALVLPRMKTRQELPVLGVIEFASMQALEVSTSKRIGVVANPVTVRSKAYEDKITTLNSSAVVVQQACPEWVPMVEAGLLEGEKVESQIRRDMKSIIKADVDTLILGCTHYPYLSKTIKKILGDGVHLVDPSAAVAIHLKNVLETYDLSTTAEKGEHKFYVSGAPQEFKAKSGKFFTDTIDDVCHVTWCCRTKPVKPAMKRRKVSCI
ncbi:MAG: glutamate racemase [Vulcanimicrobiota bacterium]